MAEQGTPPNAVKGGVVAYLSARWRHQGGRVLQKGVRRRAGRICSRRTKRAAPCTCIFYINGSSVMMSDPYPEHGHAYVPAAGFSA